MMQIASAFGLRYVSKPDGVNLSCMLYCGNTLLPDSTRLSDIAQHMPDGLSALQVRECQRKVRFASSPVEVK